MAEPEPKRNIDRDEAHDLDERLDFPTPEKDKDFWSGVNQQIDDVFTEANSAVEPAEPAVITTKNHDYKGNMPPPITHEMVTHAQTGVRDECGEDTRYDGFTNLLEDFVPPENPDSSVSDGDVFNLSSALTDRPNFDLAGLPTRELRIPGDYRADDASVDVVSQNDGPFGLSPIVPAAGPKETNNPLGDAPSPISPTPLKELDRIEPTPLEKIDFPADEGYVGDVRNTERPEKLFGWAAGTGLAFLTILGAIDYLPRFFTSNSADAEPQKLEKIADSIPPGYETISKDGADPEISEISSTTKLETVLDEPIQDSAQDIQINKGRLTLYSDIVEGLEEDAELRIDISDYVSQTLPATGLMELARHLTAGLNDTEIANSNIVNVMAQVAGVQDPDKVTLEDIEEIRQWLVDEVEFQQENAIIKYTINEGDSLSSIVKDFTGLDENNYGQWMEEIKRQAKANFREEENPDNIKAGETLFLTFSRSQYSGLAERVADYEAKQLQLEQIASIDDNAIYQRMAKKAKERFTPAVAINGISASDKRLMRDEVIAELGYDNFENSTVRRAANMIGREVTEEIDSELRSGNIIPDQQPIFRAARSRTLGERVGSYVTNLFSGKRA